MDAIAVQIERALAHIEAHLEEPLALRDVARAAGMSPWHFHRVFAALVGETPAGYVRRRRLGDACRRLVESDEPIAALALASGFESQASFTRAFTREIGVSPGRYRRARLVAPAHFYPRLDLSEHLALKWRNEMEPRIVEKEPFHVVGLCLRFTPGTNNGIPELWSRFAPRMGEIAQRRGKHSYGICIPVEGDEQASFDYVAGVEVEPGGPVPDGMIELTVTGKCFAVFTHRGHISRILETVKQVWGVWLPASSLRYQHHPDFELYDDRFDPTSGDGEVDIYVPIDPESAAAQG
jgi:AraC family transcriptional regulator